MQLSPLLALSFSRAGSFSLRTLRDTRTLSRSFPRPFPFTLSYTAARSPSPVLALPFYAINPPALHRPTSISLRSRAPFSSSNVTSLAINFRAAPSSTLFTAVWLVPVLDHQRGGPLTAHPVRPPLYLVVLSFDFSGVRFCSARWIPLGYEKV